MNALDARAWLEWLSTPEARAYPGAGKLETPEEFILRVRRDRMKEFEGELDRMRGGKENEQDGR